MTKPINEYTVKELSAKIEAIKAEREQKANALKRYEEKLERRKQEVPLGVPSKFKSKMYYFLNSKNEVVYPAPFDTKRDGLDRQLACNVFESDKSAEKHREMLLVWRKALVANAKGEPIDIQVLLPLLKKGWVVMTQEKQWLWFENKPYISVMDLWSSCIEKDGHKEYIRGEWICLFNIKPVKDWRNSMMECGL